MTARARLRVAPVHRRRRDRDATVFRRPKTTRVHRSREEAIVIGDPIAERHFHGMVVIVILVHQHHGPLPVGPLQGISRHQRVSVFILHVARDFEELVDGIHRLHPFLRDHLRREILRRIVLDVAVVVHRQEAASAALHRSVVM